MDSRPVVISVGVGVLSLDKWDTCEEVWVCVCACRVEDEGDDEEGRMGTARRGIRPGAAGAGFTGWKFIICTCILHLTSSIGVLESKRYISQPKTSPKKGKEKETNKTKLVKNPAPPAANPSCGIVRRSVVEDEVNVRMTFWNAEYVRKRDAVSAIEPTIGAGNP